MGTAAEARGGGVTGEKEEKEKLALEKEKAEVTRSGTRLRFARFLMELEAATPIERKVTFELPGGATFTMPEEGTSGGGGRATTEDWYPKHAGVEFGDSPPVGDSTAIETEDASAGGVPRVSSPPPRVAASVVRLPPPVETSNPFGVFSDTGEVDIEAAAVEEELPVGRAVGDEVDVPTFLHSHSPTRIGGGTHVMGDDFALEDGGVRPPGEEGLFSSGAGVPSVSSPERSGEHTSDSQAYNITRFVILEPSPLIVGPEERSASLTPLPLAILPPSRQYREGLDRDP
ncbi:hypothetical protein Droror1_Dr00000850 [Drosera rotundifolia]